MSGGLFMVSRGIWDHPEFAPSEYSEREAFLWLVSEAAWKPHTARAGRVVVDLDRGQLCASVRFMAVAWGWSKSRVDRFLKRLENRDMLKSESGTGQLVITLCNYDKFQTFRDTSGTRAGQNPGHERDTSGTNYKKGKQEKHEEEEPKGSLSPDAFPKPFDEIAHAVAAYNEAADASGWPRVQVLSKSRRAALTARLKECGGVDGWAAALQRARASPHLCGQNDRGWLANFDFLTRQSSFTKLMEGNYDPATRTNSQRNPNANPASRAIHDALRMGAAQRFGNGGG